MFAALDAAGVQNPNIKRARTIAARYARRIGAVFPLEHLGAVLAALEKSEGNTNAAWRAAQYIVRGDELGARDIELAKRCAAKLARRIRADGREISQASVDDATGAGVLALVQWRLGAGAGENSAARVAWRAVVDDMSRDTIGTSTVCVHTVDEDWLWFNRSQGDESREERAARFKVERMAARRIQRLAYRVAQLPAGRGKRKEVIERVQRAATFLVQGETLDEAAKLAGFNASGDSRAGDRLIQAVKRLGLIGDGFAIRRASRRR